MNKEFMKAIGKVMMVVLAVDVVLALGGATCITLAICGVI